ncbi:DNA topoisomerase 1 [Endomicrobiia bacterium]|uniref:type I DNA topoisomerase n=1 Tax=Endomicrobium trichonymphae TaxID=1408204 RepID=UPI0018D5A043|nr:type I DNA topoisomerase [Candidatus Endomicrobium trichonymphae]GHT24714.1 DNA topoisomerase 1 [Endomicrobiia bacterium]
MKEDKGIKVMSKYLVIVESPTKEKTISKILGKDFTVKSSYGHIRDLPKNKLGIDIEDNFKPTYKNISKSKKLISDLKKKAENSDKIYLATDFDREGEAIAWHLKEALKLPESKISRITFHEITTEAILKAVKHPRNLDMKLVNSQQARRILDRLVGYKLSPLLWKKVKPGLSAGRVQSVAVMLICKREEEFKSFIPVEYWSIEAELSKLEENTTPFKSLLFSKNDVKFDKLSVKNKEQSDETLKELEGAKYIVKSVETKQRKRSPYAPYTTSTMQQDASRKLGFSASKTMSVAQKLYEGVHIGNSTNAGLITYMRTDSLNIAKSVQSETLKFIEYSYGSNFLPKIPRIYKTKTKGAQEAHEAIRPISPNRIPSEVKQYLSEDELKLYNLIWKRFLASQMADAVYNTVTAEILAKDYLFKSLESTLIFDGFLKVYNADDDEKETKKLPSLKSGEQLNLLRLLPLQHFTEPPPLYDVASLIKALEEHGIGRPSTYAPTIKTILDRLYVHLDGKKFVPTNRGIVVNNVLKDHFGNIINVEFTASVEEKLDKIAEDKAVWQNVLKDFYKPFEKDLSEAEKNLQKQKVQAQQTSEICPNCGKNMVIRYSRKVQFLGCSGYPECKTTLSLDKDGKIAAAPRETDMKCDKCGSHLIKKTGFAGKQYLSCKNYLECKTLYNINKDGNMIIYPEPEHTDIKCNKCGSEMLKKIGKRGPFLTCSAFPKCRNLQWIKTNKTPKSKTYKTVKLSEKKTTKK